MKFISTAELRAGLAHYAQLAETEAVYVSRPGGKILVLSAVNDGDRRQLLRALGEKKTLKTTKN